ncbi:hypothetical protein D3C77_564830 [compost metagenome]
MSGADGHCQIIHRGRLSKLQRFVTAGDQGVFFVDRNIILGAADLANFAFDPNVQRMGNVRHGTGDPHVFVK